MEYLDTKSSWEEFFTKEYSKLKAKLPELESGKSSLRLALENRILDWKTYESWAIQKFGCASIKEATSEATLSGFLESAKTTFSLYSSHSFWNQDLIPVFFWEDQLIVIGLHYNPELAKIPNHVFIFASPKTLAYFSKIVTQNNDQEITVANLDLQQNFDDNEVTQPNFDVSSLKADSSESFDIKLVDPKTNETPAIAKTQKELSDTSNVWEVISERYEEYLFESQKSFQALVILKIKFDKTQVFRFDKELTKKDLNEKVFEYSIAKNAVFKDICRDGMAKKTLSNNLGLDMLNYENVCISPIKTAGEIVGFFLGFKHSQITAEDVSLLEDLTSDFSQAA